MSVPPSAWLAPLRELPALADARRALAATGRAALAGLAEDDGQPFLAQVPLTRLSTAPALSGRRERARR